MKTHDDKYRDTESVLRRLAELLKEKAAIARQQYKDADEALSRFIAAPEINELEFTRPADETIEAYILGYADETQYREILQCIASSRSFRYEMLILFNDVTRVITETEILADRVNALQDLITNETWKKQVTF
ncbi:MAG: hypothetical protein R3F48_01670 [Candidatus Zixiibacteriota bacterium]